MKFSIVLAWLTLALAASTALAQGAVRNDAQLPAPLGAQDQQAVGLWYRANVQRGEGWWVRFYSADALFMTRRGTLEDKNGHVQAEVRIEVTRPQTLAGFNWRSARLTADIDCDGAIRVVGSRTPPQPDPQRIVLAVYEGQNLTGPGKSYPLDGMTALPAGPMGERLKEVCQIAIADKLDVRNAGDTTAVGYDEASLRAWASGVVKAGAGETTFYQPGQIILASTPRATAAGRYKVAVRTEYVDPLLTRSVDRQNQASRFSNEKRARLIVPAGGRPIWIRSEVKTWEFDCAARKAQVLDNKLYTRHNLKDMAEEDNDIVGWRTVREDAYLFDIMQKACAAK